MSDYLIATRYASGLGATIPDQAELDGSLAALNSLQTVLERFQELWQILQNPGIDLEIRAKILDDVLRAEEIPNPVAQLARLLAERGRLALLPEIVGAFGALVDKRLDRVAATVTTAAPLTSDQEKRLQEALSRYAGKEVRLECSVEPGLIGGVVAQLGGEIIDGSILARLERLKETLIAQEM